MGARRRSSRKLLRGNDQTRLDALADMAAEACAGLLATNDVRFHHPDRRRLADVLTATPRRKTWATSPSRTRSGTWRDRAICRDPSLATRRRWPTRETEQAEVPITHLICRRLADRSDLLDRLLAAEGDGGRGAWGERALGRADEVRRPGLGWGRPDPEGAPPRLPRSRDFR